MPPDCRHQVFVSSTFEDLKTQRDKVISALLKLGAIPAGMELFPASDADSWALIQKIISTCDYYVVIVAGRYGTLTDDGLSYTEREYNYAEDCGIPVLAFLHGSPGSIAVDQSDTDVPLAQRLADFRNRLKTSHACRHWNTTEELLAEIYPSFIEIRESHPRPGWIRADSILTVGDLGELTTLREEVSSLRAEREANQAPSPSLAGDLQQGEDLLSISWSGASMRITDKGSTGLRRIRGDSEISWDDLFTALGPLMYEDASEAKLLSELTRVVSKQSNSGTLPQYFSIDREALDTVKTQFLALGFIRKSLRRRAVHDTETYWSLTPRGERYLISSMALRRTSEPAAGPAVLMP
jgi:Domain of unknown function (DUF4062)